MESKEFDPGVWSLSPIDGRKLEECRVGLLSFDKDEGVLFEIPVGSLGDSELQGFIPETSAEETQVVYGYSRSGKHYLLERAQCVGATGSTPGMKSERYRADVLLVSSAPLDADPKVTSVALYLAGLREWVGWAPMKSTYSLTEDGRYLQACTLEYDSAEVREPIVYEDDVIKIQVRHSLNMPGGRLPLFKNSFETEYHITFELKVGELPLNEMLDTWVFPIRNLLAFCMGFRSEVTRVAFATEKERGCELYTRVIGSPFGKEGKELQRMPLSYKRIESRLTEMAGKWLALDGYAGHAAKSFVALLGRWEMPLNLEFFASAVVLEALSHGVDRDGDEMVLLVSEDTLQAVKASEMQDDIKDVVIRELYRHQNSNDLTDKLLAELGEYAEYVVPNLQPFMKEHRDARNGHAHLNPDKLKKSPQLADLYVHTKAVQLLCYGALCMRLGMSAKDALDAIKESRFMAGDVKRSRRYYAAG